MYPAERVIEVGVTFDLGCGVYSGMVPAAMWAANLRRTTATGWCWNSGAATRWHGSIPVPFVVGCGDGCVRLSQPEGTMPEP